MKDPSPNFYRFSTDGAQWLAGLGDARAAEGLQEGRHLIAEDYSFPYSQVQGFMIEYCKGGGRVVDKFWVPIGNKDYSSIIAKIPSDVDAVYVVLGGADAVNFLTQYEQAGGDKPLVGGLDHGGPDGAQLQGQAARIAGRHGLGRSHRRQLRRPGMEEVRRRLQGERSRTAFPSPSLFAHAYYINTKAALDALNCGQGRSVQQSRQRSARRWRG